MKKVFVHKGALIRKVAEEEAVRLKARGFKELNPPAVQPVYENPMSESNSKQLSKMTKAELEALAREKDIEVPERATKEYIINLLEGVTKE